MPLFNNMKKAPTVLLIPAIAVALILGGALVYKLLFAAPQTVQTSQMPHQFPNSFSDSNQTGEPSTFLGGLFAPKAPAISPTPVAATANDLSTQLKDTVDDGGQRDLDALQQDTQSL